MKKITSLLLLILTLALCLSAFASCSPDPDNTKEQKIKIAIPNDPTNEARALKLLQAQGLITLKSTVKDEAAIRDIEKNPYNIEFVEMEAALLPTVLKDVSFAVINSNYAIGAGITPFVTEGTDISFPNIISVKAGNENSDKVKALVAAVNSTEVQEYIKNTYRGAIVCDLKNVTDGTDSTVDYEALKGATIKIAASPTPHADILKVAKTVLAKKDITLDIVEFDDYVQPNEVVESGEFDANYFQHIPYMNQFNEANGTHIVSVLEVHHEPMGVYSDSYTSFEGIISKK